ncbi:MAG TPA: hypothetical protein HPQ04_09030 [Rhodospirillaceae bacterium]|nr:hypothetical protein [Rhodospirillaceae bacterium]
MIRAWIAASEIFLFAACAPLTDLGLPKSAALPLGRAETAVGLLPGWPDPDPARLVSAAASRQGSVAIALDGIDGVLAEVAAGHAVVMGTGRHAPVVAAGFDVAAGEVLLVGGPGRIYRQPLAAWRDDGDPPGFWAVAVVPPGELPVAADCAAYLRAAARLLQLGSPWEAVLAFDAGVARWPEDADALAGLGASLGHLGDPEGAARAMAAAQALSRDGAEKDTSRSR